MNNSIETCVEQAWCQHEQWLFSQQFFGVGDIEEQIASALTTLSHSMSEASLKDSDLIKCTITLTDIRNVDRCISSYQMYIGTTMPVMTFLAQQSLPEGKDFCIDVIGIKSDSNIKIDRFYRHETDRYPCSIRVDKYVFTSVCCPTDGANMQDQARSSIKLMLSAFEMAGCSKKNIARNLIYLTDCSWFTSYNEVYGEFFQRENDPPARSLFGVFELPGEVLLAMEGVGYLGEDRQELTSNEAPASKAPFCQGIRVGNLIFVSGQVGRDRKQGGELLHPFDAETRQTFRNILSITTAGGAGAEDILKCSGYLSDTKYVSEFEAIRHEVSGNSPWANTVYKVEGLASPILAMEVDVIAAVHNHNDKEDNLDDQ